MKKFRINKIISSLTAAVLLTVSAGSVPAKDTAVALNTDMLYRVYDADTGTLLRNYELEAQTYSPLSTRGVIGNDERVIDYTKNGVCKIVLDIKENDADGIATFGSGFVVDEHTIATAAHCVYNYTIDKIYLFNSNGSIAETIINPVEYHIPDKYITGVRDYENDYALITVEEDLSDYMCFNLGVVMDSFKETGASLSATGFPGTVNGVEGVNTDTKHAMYTGNGNIYDLTEHQIYATTDISGGNSGGPMYITESRCGKTYYTVVGIVSTGSASLNMGARMSTDKYRFYLCNSNLIWSN